MNYLLANISLLDILSLREVIETSIGSDQGAFLANLFLYYSENKWILNLNQSNLHKVNSFANIFRYIDELYIVNHNCLIEKHLGDIYPEEKTPT